jgi:hypothetical protein
MNKPSPHVTSGDPLPAAFHRIRLALARESGHPEGSRDHGYDLVVPLDASGRLDPAWLKTHRDRYRFVHFTPGAERKAGHLVHRPGGSWAFHYDISGDEDDAGGYRFQSERFVVGEYVPIREGDQFHTYQVVAVGPV